MKNPWKPIETAPKDGTEILVCHEWYQPETAYWGTYHPNSPGKKCWRASRGGVRILPWYWMELPPKPSKKKTK